MASNKHVTNGVTAGRFRLTHLAVAGGAVMLLAACGTRGLTTAEPAARVVSICPTPGKARLACDQDDQREIAAARRLIERQRGAATTTAATTTPTTAATTTSTAAPATTVAETTVATEATAAPVPEDTAPPVEAAPVEAAPVEEAPAPEEAAPAEEPAPEEEPATTVAKRKKTPRTTAAPVEEAPAPEAPPATEAPAPPPAAVQVDTSVAGRVIALTNAQRAAAGLSPVSANGALTAAAAAHSKDQAVNNKMTHTGSNGSTLGQRVSAAGFAWRTIGENVAMGYGSADSVMNGWMNSPGHRANILKPEFTSIGVAVAYAADGSPYWTMDLGA